jgi:hypothetical protein
MSTGTSVTESSAAAGHRQRLGECQRPEEPPLLPLEREHRQEAHRDDEQRREERRPHLDGRLPHDAPPLGAGNGRDVDRAPLEPQRGSAPLDVLVHVLDHHDRRVDHLADGDGDPAERHDVGADAQPPQPDERHEHADREHDDRHERRAHVQQEGHADDRDDDGLLGQRAPERADRALDQPAPVVDGAHHHARREPALDLREARLDALDGRQRVLPHAHDDDPADRVAAPVQIGEAAAHRGAHARAREVGHADGRAGRRRADDHLLDVADRLEVAEPAHHVLALGELHHHRADVGVGVLDGAHDGGDGHAVGLQLGRVDVHLVLLLEAADARHLGDAGDGRERVAQVPVLHSAQLGQVQPPGGVLERVLVDPAEPRGVGAERGADAGGQALLDPAQIFEHARARPVEVRAVLEDHVHERHAEERVPAHRARAGHLEHLGGDRVGDLVLDDARGPARRSGPRR